MGWGRAARLHAQADRTRLRRTVQSGARGALVFAVPVTLALLFAGGAKS